MNTRTPLAAALLMTASAAFAQPLATPNFAGPNGLGGGGAGLAAPLSDGDFSCSEAKLEHIPFAPCTTAQLNNREAVKISGKCPEPASNACKDFFGRLSGAGNISDPIAAYTLLPGQAWASPTCTHIPCRTVGSPTGAIPYDQEPGFIGPPAPPVDRSAAHSGESPLPPAFDAKDFQKELADARANNEDPALKIIDLGNNRYGVVGPNGVNVCGKGQCDIKPRPLTSFVNIKDQLQAANNINSGADSINNGQPKGNKSAGFTAQSNPSNLPGASDNGSTPPSAHDVGAGIGGDQGRISKGFGTGAGSTGGAGGSDSGGDVAAKDKEVIKVDGKTLKMPDGYTYTHLAETAAVLDKTATAVRKSGGVFAAPGENADDDSKGPPITPGVLGKTQAVANGPASDAN